MNKLFLVLIIIILFLLTLAGCQRESDKVAYNLSLQADNFNIIRQLTVINCIGNDILFRMEGKMSIIKDNVDNQLEVVIADEHGDYQKHFIGLSDNVTYIVEQKNYKKVNKYKYTLNYNPKMWVPVTVKSIN